MRAYLRHLPRGLWVVVFLVVGMVALVSAMALPFDPASVFPWAIVSWPIAAYAGYRIWRADHPGGSALEAVIWRVVLVGSLVLSAVVTVVIRSLPIPAIVAVLLVSILTTAIVPARR